MENKNNKKIFIIIGIIAAIIVFLIILGVGFFFIYNLFFNTKNQEEILTMELRALGVDFYENYYYDQIGSNQSERANFLEKYKDMGLTIDLKNLSSNTLNNSDILDDFVNEETGALCNSQETKVTIYPKEPFGKKDYTIEVTLVCGFHDDEKIPAFKEIIK